MPNSSCHVAAIIITYHPNVHILENLTTQLILQGVFPIIVDNNSPTYREQLASLSESSYHFIKNQENYGIAKAQNIGMQYALEKSAKYVFTFDQDSSITSGWVNNLVSFYEKLHSKGIKVGAVGPRYILEGNEKHGQIILKECGRKLKKSFLNQPVEEPVPLDFIIASGMLTSREALLNIGLMREEFFIDQVDLDWCLRARYLGYELFIDSHTIMRHQLGESSITLPFKKTPVPLHKPFRYYYIARNTLLLLKEKHISPQWKKYLLIVFIKRLYMMVILIKNDKKLLGNYLKGLSSIFIRKK